MSKNPKIAEYDPYFGLQADNDLNIRCPYCGTDHEDLCEYEGLITYWGSEGERKEFHCEECSQIFYVKEEVRREYTSFKAEA